MMRRMRSDDDAIDVVFFTLLLVEIYHIHHEYANLENRVSSAFNSSRSGEKASLRTGYLLPGDKTYLEISAIVEIYHQSSL
jgi:hypothetical protein